MSFFDVPPPPEPPPVVEEEQPEWVGPPRGVLPGVSPQRVVLFKTDRAFSMVHRFLSYPSGVEFTLALRLRHPHEFGPALPGQMLSERPGRPLPGDFLRLGILLSDGTKWTNLDWRHPRPDQPPTEPVVRCRGGGGGGDSYDMKYWMWPLPPVGPLTVFSEWPAFDIAETQTIVDAAELRARAAEAEEIWPD